MNVEIVCINVDCTHHGHKEVIVLEPLGEHFFQVPSVLCACGHQPSVVVDPHSVPA